MYGIDRLWPGKKTGKEKNAIFSITSKREKVQRARAACTLCGAGDRRLTQEMWLVTCVTNVCKAGVYNLGRPCVVNLVRIWLVIFQRSSYWSGWWLGENSQQSRGDSGVCSVSVSHRARTALSSQLPHTGCGQRRGGPKPTDSSGQSPVSPELRPNNTSFCCLTLSSVCNWGEVGTVEIRYHNLKNLLLLSCLIWKCLLKMIIGPNLTVIGVFFIFNVPNVLKVNLKYSDM